MSSVNAITPTGENIVVDAAAIDAFRNTLRGELLTPESADYTAARTIWNAMIDARPALIARCRGADDVIRSVQFAREHALLLSVRGGGHNVAGTSLVAGGLTIDVSRMRGVIVDAPNRTVRAEPGLTWAELDRETLACGLATTGGTVSSTGIAGLTLGGGLGWQMARHGLTCDNLLSADIVTADGRLLGVSASQHEDLFWAVRGGGGNFGIITSFEYQLHPMPPLITGGMILYPIEQAREVLRAYRTYSRRAADDFTAFAGLLTLPTGHNAVAIIAAWFGPAEQAAEHIEPLRTCGTPMADLIGQMPYEKLQTLFDAAVPLGLRRYWKSGYVRELPDDLIDTVVAHAAAKTSSYSLILFFHMHGAAARVPPDATAFGARARQWDFDIIGQWTEAAEDQHHVAWARRFWKDVEPFTQGVYTNHLDRDDGASRVRAAYGTNYERLVLIKRKYDPGNLFKSNSNVATLSAP